MTKHTLILILVLFAEFSTLHAQNGSLDSSFDSDGIVTMDINNSNDVMKSIITQPDGKIIVVGYSSNSVMDNFCLVRFNSNGSIDLSFGINGIVITNFSYTSIASDVALQLDGKIVVVGHTWSGTENQFALARYNGNGTLDTSFGNLGIVSSSFINKNAIARTIKIQNDGKIVVAGHIYTLNNDFDEFAIARYTTYGALDPTFGNAGQVTTNFGPLTRNWINSIELQDDGKIVAGGFSDYLFALVRYNSNGTLDFSFGASGLVTTAIPNATLGFINAVAIHSDGSIFGGGFSVDTFSNFTVAKYNSLGNLDNTFGINGIIVSQISTQQDGIKDILIQADNKLLVAGNTYENSVFQFALARFDSVGNPDATFGTNGVVKTLIDPDFNLLESIILQSDGKILATGFIGNYPYDIAVARYSSGVLSEIEQTVSIENISIYPNPTIDKLVISFMPKNKENVFIKMFDSQGQLIQEKFKFPIVSGLKVEETFLMNDYSKGIYFICIGTAKFSEVFKIVKK